MYFQTSGFHLDYVFNAALNLFKIYALITDYIFKCVLKYLILYILYISHIFCILCNISYQSLTGDQFL